MTPVLLLVVVLIGQQCSGMKIIQGFAVEIFADVFTKVGGRIFLPRRWMNDFFTKEKISRVGQQRKKDYLAAKKNLNPLTMKHFYEKLYIIRYQL